MVEVAKRLAVVVHPGGRSDAFLIFFGKQTEESGDWKAVAVHYYKGNPSKLP